MHVCHASASCSSLLVLRYPQTGCIALTVLYSANLKPRTDACPAAAPLRRLTSNECSCSFRLLRRRMWSSLPLVQHHVVSIYIDRHSWTCQDVNVRQFMTILVYGRRE
ncbi:hypothetical protein ABW21_db0206267 [Orbilia brochopaga]|nr:hypothetical protein ABW21_db0206267 [Drechslerella brochopaga]